MRGINLREITAGIPEIIGLLLITLPDCLLFQESFAPTLEGDPEGCAVHLGMLLQTVHDNVAAWSPAGKVSLVTIEMDKNLLILEQVDDRFGLIFVFPRDIPLGMVRLLAKRVTKMVAIGARKIGNCGAGVAKTRPG